MKRPLTLAVLALVSISPMLCIDSASAVIPPQYKCDVGRSRARAAYQQCFGRIRDSREATNCVRKLELDWTAVHAIVGSTCAGPRWVDNGDGTVIDNLMGLVWEKKTNADGVENLADPHDADNGYSWTNADADPTDEDGTLFTAFLASLNAGGGFAGSNGWRVPTLEDLYSIFTLVDGKCDVAPCHDPAFGPEDLDGGNDLTWSSQTNISNPGWTLLTETTAGSFSSAAKDGALFHARAVRSGYSTF